MFKKTQKKNTKLKALHLKIEKLAKYSKSATRFLDSKNKGIYEIQT